MESRGWRSWVCSDPFPGQGFQTTTPLRESLSERQVPSRLPETAIRKQSRGLASGWRVFCRLVQHWHRHKRHQIRHAPFQAYSGAASTICKEASRYLTRRPVGPSARGSQTTRCLARQPAKCGSTKPPGKAKNRPWRYHQRWGSLNSRQRSEQLS